jgi:hypothetical protein
MNDLERKKRLIVTALGAQQIYAQCHDECVDLNFFKHDLKMHSKNLVSKLERELMPVFKLMGDVQGGDAYLNAVESMEITLQNLATLPIEYWALVNQGIADIKRQIDEKNQAGADGVPGGTVTDSQSTDESESNGGNIEEPTDAPKHEATGNTKSSKKVRK